MNLATTKIDTSSTAFKSLHALIFGIAMITLNLASANAWADTLPPDGERVLEATGKFEGTVQYASTFSLRPPRRLRSHRLELAVGVFASLDRTRPFVSLGPTWRFAAGRASNLKSDVGFSPTIISGSSLGSRDLGGNLHFTSSVSIGGSFGEYQQVSVSLRAQHTSNGGLNSTNPGLDMMGLSFSYAFGGR